MEKWYREEIGMLLVKCDLHQLKVIYAFLSAYIK